MFNTSKTNIPTLSVFIKTINGEDRGRFCVLVFVALLIYYDYSTVWKKMQEELHVPKNRRGDSRIARLKNQANQTGDS